MAVRELRCKVIPTVVGLTHPVGRSSGHMCEHSRQTGEKKLPDNQHEPTRVTPPRSARDNIITLLNRRRELAGSSGMVHHVDDTHHVSCLVEALPATSCRCTDDLGGNEV